MTCFEKYDKLKQFNNLIQFSFEDAKIQIYLRRAVGNTITS